MQYVDKNQDGVISLEELEDVMDKILLKIDQNSNDVITFDEVIFPCFHLKLWLNKFFN